MIWDVKSSSNVVWLGKKSKSLPPFSPPLRIEVFEADERGVCKRVGINRELRIKFVDWEFRVIGIELRSR